MKPRPSPPRPDLPVARFVGGLMGFIFLSIGLTVLGFLWLQPFGQFGSPPLFFRLFGSFIALGFVGMGGAVAYGALTGRLQFPADRALSHLPDAARDLGDASAATSKSEYVCRQCGAPLAGEAEVSPHGDVKCTYCACWFNVHGK